MNLSRKWQTINSNSFRQKINYTCGCGSGQTVVIECNLLLVWATVDEGSVEVLLLLLEYRFNCWQIKKMIPLW